jgi:hypothetical protein
MEVSGQLRAPTTLSPGKERPLGGPQRWSERGGEKKNLLPYPKIKPSAIQTVTRRYTVWNSPAAK